MAAWVRIQENTFRNWVNEQLRPEGMEVLRLDEDFCDGIKLCKLISALQGKRIKYIQKPRNQHQVLQNVSDALKAIENDNIRLWNIGAEDIVNGNLKLILGLIWQLILHYHIGKSKVPIKKIMVTWLRAVIPECNITNFFSDWKDGIALHALIDFCKSGLSPEWKQLRRSDGLSNCRKAMMLANQHFNIPLVVRPEDLSSIDLDELSGITYLSYFMRLDSPGYHMTLNLVRSIMKNSTISNFTSDWSDGWQLCNLVKAVGGSIPGYRHGNSIENIQLALDEATQLGIEPLPFLSARNIADPNVHHLDIMAYVAYFIKFKPVRNAEKEVSSKPSQNVTQSQEMSSAGCVPGRKARIDVGSTETFDVVCSPCKQKNRIKEADKYCVDCQDYYCSKCVKVHADVPALSRHNILSKADFNSIGGRQGLPVVPTERCNLHKTKLVDMYCDKHDRVGCHVCMSTEHGSCKVQYIPGNIKQLYKPSEMNVVQQDLTTTCDNFRHKLTAIEHAKKHLQKVETDAIGSVHEFKQHLLKKIEQLEQTAVKDIKTWRSEVDTKLCNFENKLQQPLKQLEDRNDQLEQQTSDANQNNAQLFVQMKQTKAELSALSHLSDIQIGAITRIIFQPDDQLKRIIRDFGSLGKVRPPP